MATDTQWIDDLEQLRDARVRDVVVGTCRAIQEKLPGARFRVSPNPAYRGAILDVYTDTDDTFAVLEPVSDRLVDLLVNEDISIRIMHRSWDLATATGTSAS